MSLRTGSCSGTQGQRFTYNADGDRLSASDLATNNTLSSMTYNQADELTGYSAGSTSAYGT